mmetsp:Transcript_13539/g.16268  ORF Transcript_13539/g.16268 Transcript_13539/m.16268 type:complete len:177 (-) Transcript_13539:174-704(-)
MGSVPFCSDCSELCTEQQVNQEVQVRKAELEIERMQAARKLFELTDLNDDGYITVDEFVLMGLNQTRAHAEKKMSPEEEQRIKYMLAERFHRDIDSSFRPVNYDTYRDYILRSVNTMDPGDVEAQSMIFDGLLVEATIARQMVQEQTALPVALSLPTILTSLERRYQNEKLVITRV